jgi:hypothetical protein
MTRFVAILPDAASMECARLSDQGWRLRVEYDPDYMHHVQLCEEQVLPELVMRENVNRIRAENGRVSCDLDEARWLRAQLDTVIALMERDEAQFAKELAEQLADKHAGEGP